MTALVHAEDDHAAGGRIMITFNVKDFPRVCVEWMGAGRHHAGCLILVGIDHGMRCYLAA